MYFSIDIYFVLTCANEAANGLEKSLKLSLCENYVIFKSIYIVMFKKNIL